MMTPIHRSASSRSPTAATSPARFSGASWAARCPNTGGTWWPHTATIHCASPHWATYRHDPLRFTPLGYLNILQHKTVALVGGGSVDGRAFADIPAPACREIRDKGGVLFCLLRYAFTEMADDFEAFFGYCGDARAEEVDLQAGFRHTRHPKLLANYHRPLDAQRRDQLLDDVFALGPF